MTTYRHVLHGCAPVPLAGYLKALGVFRLIAEQAEERLSKDGEDGDHRQRDPEHSLGDESSDPPQILVIVAVVQFGELGAGNAVGRS